MILLVKCSYFETFIEANRPCFFPHTFPYNGSLRNLTPSHAMRDAFMN